MYQQAGEGFIYFVTLRIISQDERTSFLHILWIFSCFSVGNCQPVSYLSVTGFCKKIFLVFLDQLKVYLKCSLVSWFSFHRKKIRRRISSDNRPWSDFVLGDEFYPIRARRNYSVGYKSIYVLRYIMFKN